MQTPCSSLNSYSWKKNTSSYLLSSLAFAYFRANVVLMLEQLRVNVNIRTVPFDEDAQRGLIDR